MGDFPVKALLIGDIHLKKGLMDERWKGCRYSPMKKCSYCERPAHARGLCTLHYQRAQSGKPMDDPVRVVGKYAECKVEECSRKHKGHGYCEKHLDRWKRYGDPLLGAAKTSLKVDENLRLCDGCGEVKEAEEFYQHPTRGHYDRWCKPCRSRKAREQHVRRKYGEEALEIERRLLPGETCEICGERPDRMALDHDHKTGFPRGVLCRKHNAGLGAFGDSIELLESAIRYLREKSATCQSSC